jgi:hypothetical protein
VLVVEFDSGVSDQAEAEHWRVHLRKMRFFDRAKQCGVIVKVKSCPKYARIANRLSFPLPFVILVQWEHMGRYEAKVMKTALTDEALDQNFSGGANIQFLAGKTGY